MAAQNMITESSFGVFISCCCCPLSAHHLLVCHPSALSVKPPPSSGGLRHIYLLPQVRISWEFLRLWGKSLTAVCCGSFQRQDLSETLPVPPQVPQDDWGGYPGDGKDDEIPCRRMRSSSYVKAMGDEESGESDSSPKASPQKSVRPDALVKSVIRPRDLLDSQRYIMASDCHFFVVV